MIVTQASFQGVLETLSQRHSLVVDTETTGLEPWLGDRLFSIIIGANPEEAYYFNFNEKDGTFSEEERLPRSWLQMIAEKLFTPDRILIMHNAKFDLAILWQEGVIPASRIYDTEVMARLQYNDHMRYRLEDCAKRVGLEKSDAVEIYIKEHKLSKNVAIPGRKKKKTLKRYDLVPRDVMAPYGITDGKVTFDLYCRQVGGFSEQELALMRNEMRFTRVLFDMECLGVKVDKNYCAKAFAMEHSEYVKAEQEFKAITGEDFLDSGKNIARILGAAGVSLPLTEKGNFQVSEKVLAKLEHPIARVILKHRDHYKRAHTYYQNLILCADADGLVHTDFKQAGARTGRLSCKNPNLQNIPKQDADEEDVNGDGVKIRKAFVPRPGYFFAEIDYKAMEFRMMLDYAGQVDLIEAIKAGLDPHQATADLAGITRRDAKTLNFLLLYGGGVEKLAGMLKISVPDATRLRAKYFASLGGVKRFIRGAISAAQTRGWVMNWAGRRYYYPNSEFAYKGPNAIIQGGSAEAVKYAMVDLFDYLEGRKSRMVLQVHDSVLFEVHESEAGIVPELSTIMARAYPHKLLAMDCDIKWSRTSWGELEEWGTFEATRDGIQGKGETFSSDSAARMV